MRRDDELERPAGAGAEDEAEPRSAGGEDGGRVKGPDPEEVPELLGERSDYPIPRGEDEPR